MRRRSERTVKELYDRTERVLEAEINPVQKGSYRMEGPVDDSDLEFGKTNLEQNKFVNDFIGMKIASGTCSICSAPCSSCMHDLHSSSVIGSTSDSGCSGNICSRGKSDIFFSNGVNTFSETSKVLAMNSSHNSYSENAESKSTLKASAAHDLEDLEKSLMGVSGEITENKQPLEEKTCQAHFSADSRHLSIHLDCKDPSSRGEDQLGLECHGDNISCITGGTDANISDYGENLYLGNSLRLNANEISVLPEAGDGSQVHETEKGDFILQRSNSTADASMLNDASNSAPVSKTPDDSGFAPLKVDVSPIRRIHSSFHEAEFRDTEGNLNMKLQAGCIKFAKMDNVESSLATFSSVSSAGRILAALPNVEVSRTNEAGSCLSSERSKVNDSCQEFRTDTDSQISSDNGYRSGDLNEDLETNDRQGNNLLPLANSEKENSESEIALYDVRVCDICGDAGREALLAICSRCSDGSEHTYCMREKLDKVPGADWLCEECKIKENEEEMKASEASAAPKETASPRTPVLSHVLSSESQPVIDLQDHSRNSLNSGSFKDPPQAHSTYRHFSRSESFSNSIIHQNVKQLVENVRYKQKINREEMGSKLRNETLVKSINKSASFKSSSSGFSNTEPASKDQPFHPPRIENPRGMDEVKERITLEKKNPSAAYKPSISKLAAPASFSQLKRNRSSQKERNLKSAIESSCQNIVKRSYDASDSGNRDSNIFISPTRLSSSSGKQALHLPKRNKAGHATQQCSADELQGCAYQPSDERSLSEMMGNGNECEDVVDAMAPKAGILNKGKNLDKVQVASAEVICEADSRNTSFNIASAVDSGNGDGRLKKLRAEVRKAVAGTDTVNLNVHPTQSLLVADRLRHISTVNSLSETSPGEASILASQLRASAIPKLEFIWQGSLNVLRSDSCLQSFDGIQAHLSTCASHTVLEVANLVPNKIQMEEVSQTNFWPLQCQGIGPNEENIALFFFAEDNERYEKSYSSLLNKMLKNDLALRGKVDEAELFIFTSKILPSRSQRWNMLYYLWGMFIGKRKHSLPTQKKNSELPLRNGGPNALNSDTSVASKILSEFSNGTNKKRKRHCSPTHLSILDHNNPRKNISEIAWADRKHARSSPSETLQTSGERARLMRADDERERKTTHHHTIGRTFGEEDLISTSFSQQNTPEISRIVERSLFPVDIGSPAHIPSLNDDDDSPESYTPDLELTLGSKSETTKPAAPLLPFLLPSVDRSSLLHRRSVPSGNDGDGDDLSALLSL